MAKVKHLSDGNTTWDVGGGTEVFTASNAAKRTIEVTISSVTVSGTTASVVETSARILDSDGNVVGGYLMPAPYAGLQVGDLVHIVFIGTLPADTVDTINIGNMGAYVLNLSTAGAMRSEYFATMSTSTFGQSTMAETAAPAPTVYDRLKVVAPLKVTNDGNDDCLGADVNPAKHVVLEYDTNDSQWKLYTYNRTAEVPFDDVNVGDIITVTPYNAQLPGKFRFIGSLKDYNDYIYLQYAGAVATTGIAMTDGSGTILVHTNTPNYAQWKGIYSQDQLFSSSGIYTASSADDIADILCGLKNVVDVNDDFTDANYLLFGYGPNGVIQNLNSSVYRILYDDGSFAMIYYPEAGTIPDGITPGFTAGPTSTPPAGNWQPRVVYDSVFFFSGGTKCSKALQYNGQGFYGTPASGSGVYYTDNTDYFIVFGHLNDKYMQLED